VKIKSIELNNQPLKKCPIIIVGIFEDKKMSKNQKEIDDAVNGIISSFLKRDEFKCKRNTTALLYSETGVERVLLLGLGERKGFSLHNIRQVMGTAMKKINSLKLTHVYVEPIGKAVLRKPMDEILESMVVGGILGGYEFLEYKTDNNKNHLEIDIDIWIEGKIYVAQKRAIEKGQIIAESVSVARDLAHHPGNIATPTYLAKIAQELGENAQLKCTILDEKNFRKFELGAIAGVSKGSGEPAKLIILEYKTKKKTAKTLGLVGKGLTFDSGGISLKPGAKMDEMKFDMCGAATVFGTMHAIAKFRPRVNVIAVIAAVENMPGGGAYKPGDILKAYNGKTIEVLNTDAEGRIVLADAISFITKNYQLDGLVDFATLTGAVINCLGHEAAAIMSPDSGLVKKLMKSSENTDEKLWELPLWNEFCEETKSQIADIKNTGSRGAGTIMGAAFLKEFVEENVPWAHIDIAGVAWDSKERPCTPKGASGYGVRLMIDLIERF